LKKRKYIFGIIGLAIFGFALFLLINSKVPAGSLNAKEIAAVSVILLLIWGIYQTEKNADRSLIQRLWQLGLYIGLFWLGITILESVSPSIFQYAVIVLIFVSAVKLFILLRSLIFIEQSRSTAGKFRLLVFILILRVIQWFLADSQSSFLLGDDWNSDFFNSSPTGILTIIFLIMAILNGFRCKWVHYLNKKQKLGVFFAGILANGIAWTAIGSRGAVISNYSAAGEIFIESVYLFFLIYASMALLALLVQLPSAGIMDKRMQQIRYLQNLGAELGSVLHKQELLSKSCELAGKMINADVTWIELEYKSGFKFAWSAGLAGHYIADLSTGLKQDLRKLVDEDSLALLVNNTSKNPVCRRLSGGRIQAGSLLAAAVKNKDNNSGYIYSINHNRFGFTEESRGLFRAFADQIGVALENSRLAQVSIEQEVYKEELRLAHDAQMRLLPREMPNIPELEIDAFCITANEIGGDFYDIIQVSDDRTDIIIGDVSGKGASAAFYMAEMKGLMQVLAYHHDCPRDILIEINGFLKKNFEANTFVTMIYTIFFHKENKLVTARAGHPPAALVREDEIKWLESNGLGLGLATNELLRRTLKKQELYLEKGDKLIYLTDGLIEARNPNEEEYGEERYEKMLLETRHLSASGSLAAIKMSMDDFTGDEPRHDDVTLLAFKILRD